MRIRLIILIKQIISNVKDNPPQRCKTSSERVTKQKKIHQQKMNSEKEA